MRLVMAASKKTINEILGSPDDMKFRSCMTLFDAVSPHEVFAEGDRHLLSGRQGPKDAVAAQRPGGQRDRLKRNLANARSFTTSQSGPTI
jgi:Protein of unknown function (DUF1810)